MPPLTLVWFRLDLRLTDNPALQAASRRGSVLPVFIWAPDEESPWAPGSASRWWLHQSLARLTEDLAQAGASLVLRQGATLPELLRLAQETKAGSVYWNRRYEPALLRRDQQVKEALQAAGLTVETFNSALLHEPSTIQNRSGKPFQVFTPFWKTCLASAEPDQLLPAPTQLLSPAKRPPSLPLAALALEPKHDWTQGLRAAWQPGCAGAASRLKLFQEEGLVDYTEKRNHPARAGTSKLSPHLHFGEISPRQVWHAIRSYAETRSIPGPVWKSWQYLTELGWREFAHHLLYHFPHAPEQPLRPEFAHFPWREPPDGLRAWQRGRTGYPLIDAGMRELWSTGWMHNRIRMVTASFLVKNLLLPWQEGARWFWDTLVDADLANNTLGWQWTAGCGADAAPFFRIFNPVAQGRKFDPEGEYVRHWLPELGHLPAAWIHRPWEAPSKVLSNANVLLGSSYPEPLVSLFSSRQVALEAYQKTRAKGSPGPVLDRKLR